MILDRIVATKKEEVESLYRMSSVSLLRRQTEGMPETRGFHQCLLEGRSRLAAGVALIAEVKKASPSKGVIRADFDPVQIAASYEAAGASAISCLTDVQYFQGSPDYLGKIRTEVGLPLLRKDFIIDEIQIPQSRLLGADAILLIVSILEQSQLQEYIAAAKELKLDALVEVHDEEQAGRALRAGATLIGVNNRDLRDFTVDLNTTGRVARVLPPAAALVAESGISRPADVQQVKSLGASAILVGESLMREADLGLAVKRLMGEPAE